MAKAEKPAADQPPDDAPDTETPETDAAAGSTIDPDDFLNQIEARAHKGAQTGFAAAMESWLNLETSPEGPLSPRRSSKKRSNWHLESPESSGDFAWAAGFFEGEGSFIAAKGGVLLSCRQVNPEPLHELVRIFGGRLTGPYPRKQPNQVPIYYWQLRAHAAVAYAVVEMWPRLSSKRRLQYHRAVARVGDPAYRAKWRAQETAAQRKRRRALRLIS